ncbi:hypothetical protein HU200_012630 [Digitaria exilis]|uniref:rRNA N-glycosidase n=1 Tax=Digitaria exilis TaxID=1010633 RepID=A0A835KLQ5_9POAL|nr:hypothetical protein HU200_012630 [Digitaria exilis]
MSMECPSISMALVPILVLALAASSSNVYSSVASVVATTERGPPELIIVNQIHDLSLAGFANRTNHWHAFRGYEHIIPNATLLPSQTATTTSSAAYRTSRAYPWDRSGHDPVAPENADVEDALKRGLATLKVTKCEAMRLKPIKDVVSDGWENAPRVHEHFDTICFELTRAKRSGVWDGPFTDLLRSRANIHSLEDARAVVGVVVHRTFDQLLRAHARSA